jgi:hypothetical protein
MKLLYGAVAALALMTGLAQATTVTTGSAPIVYNISDPVTVGTATPTLAGTVTLSNFDFTGLDTVTFTITVKNTSLQDGLSSTDYQSIRLTAFGFNTDPNAIDVSDNSGVYETSVTNLQPLPSVGKLDYCAYSGPNCAGGAGGGLTPGQTNTFSTTLTFATDITSLDIGIGTSESLGWKFQTAFGSFEGTTKPNCPDCVPTPTSVPEPGSLVLLIGAVAGFWGVKRTLAPRGYTVA